MTSWPQRQSEDRRGIILRALDENGHRAAEATLRRVLDLHGHLISVAELHADLLFLERGALVRIDREPFGAGEVWLVHLLDEGQLVARGRAHPGIARPGYAPPQ